MKTVAKETVHCYHCGEDCPAQRIEWEDKPFCCEGCRMVYRLLSEKGMCTYYSLNDRPGITRRKKVSYDKFAFLQDDKIQQQLVSFKDAVHTQVSFYLPQVHCSSCLWLLENLHQLNEGVVRSVVNFPRKEVQIVFEHGKISLKEVAELLTAVGYEPYISLQQSRQLKPPVNRGLVYRLGVAGFCFSNIMMLSFPEYLGMEGTEALQPVFRWLNLLLALPVFFYSASPFFETAWKGLRHRFLHIDVPVAFAILVTFIRSVYEIALGTGSGFFDSMTGIVFFMLLGRLLQDRTNQQLTFSRDYQDYFPIATTVVKEEKEIPTALPDVKNGDTLRIHHEELVPADGILTRGHAFIDYSFVTGESAPVRKEMGEIIYAGGRQTGGNIELLVIKEVAQSYLTSLWNRDEVKGRDESDRRSYVHVLSRYFSYIVFAIAVTTGVYWQLTDPSRVWNAVTAVLIIACPCALLLCSTFANGNVLRLLGRNRFYLRNAFVIEKIAAADHIVFDKTGTLTNAGNYKIEYKGAPLTDGQLEQIYALSAQSRHPLSKALTQYLSFYGNSEAVEGFREKPGYGTQGTIRGKHVRLGSERFVCDTPHTDLPDTRVYVGWGASAPGYFSFVNDYREGIPALLKRLSEGYQLSVASGDGNAERYRLQKLAGEKAILLFNQSPEDKLAYISLLQNKGRRVMMIGDGLNDAGALRKSDVGIAVSEHSANFTPASDAILDASGLQKLPLFIKLCRLNRKVVMAAFLFSVIYNITGLAFAVSGQLSPLIAAILMPSSSLSILLITYTAVNRIAKRLKL